jgi:hypothetical protein
VSGPSFGTALAALSALAAAAGTFYISVWHLSRPDTLLGWLVQGSSGITVGVIVFFVVWGHFHDPEADSPSA